jgi:hypothetical protein
MTLSEKWEAHVTVGAADECWLWHGATGNRGHGMIGLPGENTTTTSQRLTWLIHRGEIPEGQLVRHTCDNPPCCNPSHLLLGTTADNVADAIERSAAWKARPGGRHNRKTVDVDEIRRRRAAGESQQTIADALGVHQATISRVLRGVHWSTHAVTA